VTFYIDVRGLLVKCKTLTAALALLDRLA